MCTTVVEQTPRISIAISSTWVYAPPWLIPSDRQHNDPAFLARTTPLRRALVGPWSRPEEPFGLGYARPPFEDTDENA